MHSRVTAFMLIVGLALSCPAQDMDSDLIGWWKLDEGMGTVVADASGAGHEGVFAEGTPAWVAGQYGGALQFDGSNKVEIPDHADFHLEDAISAALWMKPEADQPDYAKPFIKQKSGEYPYALQYNTSQGIYATVNVSARFDTAPRLDNFPGEWAHLCFTYDGNALILYKDGEEGARVAASGQLQQNDLSLSIGGRLNSGQNFIGTIDDVRLYRRALTPEEVQQTMTVAAPTVASGPNPAPGASDVPRDVILNWTAVASAQTRDVYLGLVADDVQAATRANPLGALVSQDQGATAFDVGTLAFSQTYYWRVDEVNAAPDDSVLPGDVWSFTVEPFSYPIDVITATASGSNNDATGPEKTVDGSGLDALDQHSTTGTDMWLSNAGGQPWIQYEFDRIYKLHEMWVWNSNQLIESFVGMGAKDVTIETSLDGEAWILLEDVPEFAQAPGTATYAANTVVDFAGAMAKFVRITINAGWGMVPQNGLSEVRFFYIPTNAREPQPAADVSTEGVNVMLKWRAGREAVSHEVSLGTDSAVMALVGTTTEASLDPGPLDYGSTYFWKVDEVNQAGTPTTHAGDVWSFTTPAYGIVDSFDQYDDNCMRIFFAWADGLGHNGGTEIEGCDVPAFNGNGGGSIVGNDQAPFAEQTTVTTGSQQSLPFNYDNAFGLSEATLTLSGQDWSASAVQTLSLAFYGTAGNTGTLYVKINNTKVSYDLDPADIARASWQAWNIDLTALSGLQNVTKLTIGVDGASAAGMLYIDDIRLYPQLGELITPVQPGDADLLTHLAFDEGAGAIAGDSSGNGHGADLVGAPQWATGKLGGALQFGSGSHVLDDDAEDYLNGLEALTIGVWVKSGVTDTDQGILLAKDPSDQDNTVAIRYDVAGASFGGSNVLKLAVTTDDAEQQVESSSNAQTTEWQHICMTWASGGLLRLYLDGMEDMLSGRSNANNTGPVSTCEKLIIGKGGKDIVNSAGWDGLIDELRIYGRALSAEEVMGLAGRTEPVHKPL